MCNRKLTAHFSLVVLLRDRMHFLSRQSPILSLRVIGDCRARKGRSLAKTAEEMAIAALAQTPRLH